MTYLATQSDPFAPYDKPGNGHHGNPHVPEPSVYGLLFVGLLLVVAWVRRGKK